MSARVALTVAGSDPSGGAGVQADLKTFAALGAFGTAVLTALTAQNTRGVAGVHVVPAGFVREQLEVLLDDVAVHAVKTGMLADTAITRVVAQALGAHPAPLVVDPVMVATSGDRLLDAAAVAAVRDELLPVADLVTPNVPEAAVLLGSGAARDPGEVVEQAEELLRRTGTAVLLKGGHLGGPESVDVLAEPGGTHRITRPRLGSASTHGTGCTLSSAIAAVAARGDGAPASWLPVVEEARDYLQGALAAAGDLHVGSGNGPLDHSFAQRPHRGTT
ncbi:bifunctional hydroxymethylpyrimidine kinase/phosphomethylpyrimidine kinase [Paenibacillus sp. TRM 82003]|uniref:bifunctional hydroxymethylpyrimidine kinase/phosphomethylpyrimidine kinase n=1 Tax=Kineococcus sp. TRM81007 TaxID=2925831 RepID=UPI001F5A0836|nr:bifunctional hydroxymethylpyrimidine kinase/phosphomethylpyrimidine kinase [Kineococcus sp. TRM81007]MCI2238644.1 bifunctional hydroxymethylpyrimidine kinase/phosphomethylpyrimidine kinase [Kineococcus sp. TRM81007]MCI3927306.1 bifunctional hydroxymethylpyrimidine kinase/phosphomethylpyrimidine kinase [Paenibacillus sp. TRM 82003]